MRRARDSLVAAVRNKYLSINSQPGVEYDLCHGEYKSLVRDGITPWSISEKATLEVIPFIASNYRRDKIWLRRTKPSKREYQAGRFGGHVLQPDAPA